MQITRSRRTLSQPTQSREIKLDLGWLKQWLDVRKTKLGALTIGIFLTWLLSSLLHGYYPHQLRDWLIPGSYISLLFLLWLAQLYLYSYVFLSSGKAAIVSLGVCWLVWLKLHDFELTLPTISLTVGIVAVLVYLTKIETSSNGKSGIFKS